MTQDELQMLLLKQSEFPDCNYNLDVVMNCFFYKMETGDYSNSYDLNAASVARTLRLKLPIIFIAD